MTKKLTQNDDLQQNSCLDFVLPTKSTTDSLVSKIYHQTWEIIDQKKKRKPTWIIVQVTVRKTPLSGDHILNLNKYIFHFCSSILCSYEAVTCILSSCWKKTSHGKLSHVHHENKCVMADIQQMLWPYILAMKFSSSLVLLLEQTGRSGRSKITFRIWGFLLIWGPAMGFF